MKVAVSGHFTIEVNAIIDAVSMDEARVIAMNMSKADFAEEGQMDGEEFTLTHITPFRSLGYAEAN